MAFHIKDGVFVNKNFTRNPSGIESMESILLLQLMDWGLRRFTIICSIEWPNNVAVQSHPLRWLTCYGRSICWSWITCCCCSGDNELNCSGVRLRTCCNRAESTPDGSCDGISRKLVMISLRKIAFFFSCGGAKSQLHF